MRKSYFRRKWGIRYRPGKSTKVGKVMRLKMPKVTREPRRALERSEDRCWDRVRFSRGAQPRKAVIQRTLSSRIRWIMTKLHATTKVSTELENVWVW